MTDEKPYSRDKSNAGRCIVFCHLLVFMLLVLGSQPQAVRGNTEYARYLWKNNDTYRARTEFLRQKYLAQKVGDSVRFFRSQLWIYRLDMHQGNFNHALYGLIQDWPRLQMYTYTMNKKGNKTRKDAQSLALQWNTELAYAQLMNGFFSDSEQRFLQLLDSMKLPNIKGGQNILTDYDAYRAFWQTGYDQARKRAKMFQSKDGQYWQQARSPWASGLMSLVVPGTGQIYNGKIKLGLLSLATVAGLSYWAYSNIKNGRNVAGYTSAYIASIFYFHNINRALASTHDYNRQLQQRLLRECNEKINAKLPYSIPKYNNNYYNNNEFLNKSHRK